MRNNTQVTPLSIAFILLLLAAMVGGLYLTRQNQETRRGAYFSGAEVFLQPESISGKKVGDSVPVQLWVNTENNSKVSAVDAKICFGTHISTPAGDASSMVELNQEAFKVIEYANIKDGCFRLVAVSSGIAPENLKSGTVKVATLRFVAKEKGTGSFTLNASSVKVSGYNPAAGATDTSMKISSVKNATYTIGDGTGVSPTDGVTPTDGVSPTDGATPTDGVQGDGAFLKFDMALAGVFEGAKCQTLDQTKLTVTVRSNNGDTKTYENVKPASIGEKDGLAVYHVKLRLDGFAHKDDLAVFVKGPKHLQVKYAKDGQDDYYSVAGGELGGLTKDEASTPTFDFTGYPLLAGDVTGTTAGSQDGNVDGLDFSYVKSEAIKRTEITEGSTMKSDLNGNCKMESQDVSLLMLSLAVKQEQLY